MKLSNPQPFWNYKLSLNGIYKKFLIFQNFSFIAANLFKGLHGHHKLKSVNTLYLM